MKARIAAIRLLAILALFILLVPAVRAQGGVLGGGSTGDSNYPPRLPTRGYPSMFPPLPPSPPGRIIGYVLDGSNNPIANVRVNGFMAPNMYAQTYTHTNGLFYMTVENGAWDVSVDCSGDTNSLQYLGYQCVNDETVVVTSNSYNTANFVTPPQGTAELSGTVSNINGTIISYLAITATCTTNSTNVYYAQTDWNGFYEFSLPAGDWSVMVDSNSAAAQGYSPASYMATIGSYPNQFNVDNINFTLAYASPPLPSFAEISGTISNSDGAVIPNLIVTATSSIGNNAYSTETDTNGFYEFQLPTGEWEVTVAPQQLVPLGYYTTGSAFGIGDPADEYNYTFANFILFPLLPPIPFFTNQAALGNYAYYLQPSSNNFFGYYSLENFPFVYHFDLGWEYFQDAQNAAHGAYIYDFTSGDWWYTEPGIFPYVYDFTFQAWLYCYPNTSAPGTYYSNPRIFYNFGTSNNWFD